VFPSSWRLARHLGDRSLFECREGGRSADLALANARRRMRRRDRFVDRVGVERPAVALRAERARVECTMLGDGRSKLRSRA